MQSVPTSTYMLSDSYGDAKKLMLRQWLMLDDVEFMHSLEAQSVSRPSSAAGDIDELEEKLPPLPHMRQDNTISYNQLHEFLQNCHLDIPQNAILEFLSGCTPAANLYDYSCPSCDSYTHCAYSLEADSLYVDKEGFHAFLQRHAASAPSPSKSAKNRNKKRKAKAKKRATSNAAGTAVAP
ncbi:hypothetical protein B5M09_004226 [Aphanomyces astaci]|uniref:Uncharacterized protein n=1 Tax=Aphanomyces astaci TaxID=112090 RepID=A0A3R7Y8A1_APHAT|nr:hypothetical protein B5M09_004226 [Aphanomyces astaci]